MSGRRGFSLYSLEKHCSPDKRTLVDTGPDFSCGNHMDVSLVPVLLLLFLSLVPPDKHLKYDHLLLPPLLPWVKITELFSLQDPLLEMWPVRYTLQSRAHMTAFRPESQTDLPLSIEPGESYPMSATSSSLVRYVMPLGAEETSLERTSDYARKAIPLISPNLCLILF